MNDETKAPALQTFWLRAWMTQTLGDAADYVVTAPTLAEAVKKLARAQDAAQESGQWIDLETGEPYELQHGIKPDNAVEVLDPSEIEDSERGYVHFGHGGAEVDVTGELDDDGEG